MELNFVAHKPFRREPGEPGPVLIESRKAYDVKDKRFSYHQRVTQYLHQKGGECTVGEWYSIDEYSYNLEDENEIKWDNHPKT